MPLENILPTLPGFPELLFYVVGFMGAIALGYAILLEAERRQDAVFVVGSASLFVYALYIQNKIFMLAMALVFVVSGIELVKILLGKHHHNTTMVKKYEHPEKK